VPAWLGDYGAGRVHEEAVMPTDSQGLKEYLLQSDQEFRELYNQHHELEEHLQQFSSKPYLTEQEQFEEVTIKKRKLQLKDRMEDILRRHREHAGASS
jgi:hypothetical protein